MKRLLIIGATVVALSATAVVAWAETAPDTDIESHVATQARGYDIDPVIMQILDRIHNERQWQGHNAANQVAERAHQVADPVRDATMERDVDAIREAVDQVRDRAHDVADRVRDAAHDQDMVQSRDAVHDQDMVQDRDAVHDQDMVQDWNMDRSTD
ncbi:MAG: hypothetical protein M3094_10510, partial [Actinomycetia bacterium]|nr:hypothetical protein [Actinomycetes bacterium]